MITRLKAIYFRPTPEDAALLKRLKQQFGVANPDLLRLALRKLAQPQPAEQKVSA